MTVVQFPAAVLPLEEEEEITEEERLTRRLDQAEIRESHLQDVLLESGSALRMAAQLLLARGSLQWTHFALRARVAYAASGNEDWFFDPGFMGEMLFPCETKPIGDGWFDLSEARRR